MGSSTNVCRLPDISLAFGKIGKNAEKLACLLIDTDEFKNYARLERLVSIDSQVSDITEKIHALQMNYFRSMDDEGNTVASLNDQLDALPLMQEYREAEKAVRELFSAVDEVVSQSAGIEFAANARSAFT